MSLIGKIKIKMQFVVYSKLIGSIVNFWKKVRNRHIVLFASDFLRQTLTNQYFAYLLQQILQQYCLLFDMLYAAD